MRIIRGIIAIFVGLMVISFIAEGIEMVVVTLIHGSYTTDQAVYFEIRNRPNVILLKFFYSGLAGLLGGYIAAWFSGRNEIRTGVILAIIQTITLIWGMIAPPYTYTPIWVWFSLIIIMFPAVTGGAWLRSRRKKRK
ncbi:hypothetical protein [Ectobacillus panaciterrae]|uniref:hypothetical protein n=1 Tax=Ectobacillus panaciterrae TaxID=363872 RepID=UPI00042A3858|nr:hypothetical protein [Ectobacillus panaciterrae]